MDKSEKIKFFHEQVLKNKVRYYNGQPVISDAAFDAQEATLKKLSPEDEVLASVGAAVQEEWQKANHAIPMGSLDKVKTPEELLTWVKSEVPNVGPVFKDNKLFYTEKLDGLSIEVIYENGKLTKAITRGNGSIGYDITPNVMRMSNVRYEIPGFNGSLRGEIILRKQTFEKFLKNQDYANARNAASGISKRLDGVGCEYLEIIFYQVIGNVDFDTELEQLDYIKNELQLITPNYAVATGSTAEEQVTFLAERWELYQTTLREELDWEIDGLVVRINELDDQLSLGNLHLRPYGAMAFKFRSESAETLVKNILLQVGNSGRITPVLEIEPVQLMGAEITRASLYNFGYITEIGLDVGATVLVVRANDVIPRCEVVLDPTGTVFQPPKECPVCNGDVVMNGENLHCINTDTCPAQVVGRLKNWINTLDILEWGDKLLSRLVEMKLATNVVDLYRLSVDDITKIERMGAVSARKCYEILWKHNPIMLDSFLGGLSMPMIGASTIQMVVTGGLNTLEKIQAAKCEDFLSIKGLGPVKARSLFEGLQRNSEIINGLLDAGIRVEDSLKNNQPLDSNKLNGKVICITGSTNTKRDDLIKLILSNGGEFKDSVSKGCTHLIIADPSKKSKKTENANKFDIRMISEAEFFNWLEQ
jgi:DNA ligase (NAD+)